MATDQMRRLRQNRMIRELVREVRLSPDQLMQPLFVGEGLSERLPVPGLTGTFRETPDSILKTIENDLEAGVNKFLLFSVPAGKTLTHFDSSFATSQIEGIKKRFGRDLFLATDVCLCSWTSHGHCGILNLEMDHVENGATVNELAKMALCYAQAGVDCVAPSDMMDGRIQAIRHSLDQAQLERTLIMSYSAKFHSKFYGPFRIAADSAPKGTEVLLKDRATYQIDPASPRDAFASSLRDAQEGADILMVKPGIPYLDILFRLSREIQKPWAVYEVSGEYAAIEILSQQGLIHGPLAHVEAWTALVRAGASTLITYGARYGRRFLEEANRGS